MNDYQEDHGALIEDENSNLLLIKGNLATKEDTKLYIKKVSSAMLVVIQKHGSARLRCVGAAAVNNAIKAEIIASGEAKKKGVNLAVVSSFKTVTFGENDERTAIVLEVIQMQ